MSSGEATSSRRTADALASAFARRAWNVMLSGRHLRVRRSVQARCRNQRSGGRRVVEAIRTDKRFRDTAIWVTTTRGFVSLQGCVRSPAQKNALKRVVKRQPGVVLVWNEVTTRQPEK
ncbi:MAG: BON domain-containing protein [Betaproteobacteria bacterium]|nr:MAG: BON domain-containing protein [Betaproteobacteria bacterium]